MNETEKSRPRRVRMPMALIMLLLAIVPTNLVRVDELRREAPQMAASALPDLSGLAWIESDLFLAVHDAKNPEENHRPRVSLLWLPKSLDGILWKSLQLDWPGAKGFSHDLESVARIPGAQELLLMESGDDESAFRRIFLARLNPATAKLKVVTFIEWPAPIKNVEGVAVAKMGERLIFIYAERADSQPSTMIRWADFESEPLKFGAFQEVTFSSPSPTGPNARPVSAIDVDSAGRLYVASAFDPGDDNGPFRSVVWRIGQVELRENDTPQIVLEANPLRLATLDGFKVESLAIRERPGGKVEVFAGMDDENYGNTMRLISPLP